MDNYVHSVDKGHNFVVMKVSENQKVVHLSEYIHIYQGLIRINLKITKIVVIMLLSNIVIHETWHILV